MCDSRFHLHVLGAARHGQRHRHRQRPRQKRRHPRHRQRSRPQRRGHGGSRRQVRRRPAAGLTGSGTLTFNEGSILEITSQATGFSGSQATAATVNAGTIVRLNVDNFGTAADPLENYLGPARSRRSYQLTRQQCRESDFGRARRSMTLNKNGGGVGGILTNDISNRTVAALANGKSPSVPMAASSPRPPAHLHHVRKHHRRRFAHDRHHRHHRRRSETRHGIPRRRPTTTPAAPSSMRAPSPWATPRRLAPLPARSPSIRRDAEHDGLTA